MPLCLAATPAFGSSIDAGKHIAATGDASVTKQVVDLHEHTLPSMFHKGFVYIKVSVNGHPGAWMILDTGSTESLIDTAYANAIGLKLTPSAEAQETFGSMKADTFDTDTVRLRVGVEMEKVVSFQSIALGGMMGPDGMAAAGLLGRTFLDGKSIVIDYKREEVYFETTPRPADHRDVAMTLTTGIPVIKLTIANRSVDALVDTGGTYDMIITPMMAKELGIESLMADAKPVGTVGHGGEQHIVVGRAPPFSIGDIAVNDLSAAYTTFGTATGSLGAGVALGIGFLKKYKLTLNYVADTVRFEP
ncbi:retroviral-like aspartic protease family protein [Sphingomonas sp. RT2P30]|uniref:aspartyl protease family protein n=1 Tax=Parasphingomonas halimpatiens TaxID=3096162 RepID=UPI002FC87FBC